MCSPRLLVHESHAAIVALVRLPACVHHYVVLPLLFHPEPYNSRKCKLTTKGSHPGNLYPNLFGHLGHKNQSEEPFERFDVLWVRRWLCREPELARVLPHSSQVYLKLDVSIHFRAVGYEVRTNRTLLQVYQTLCFVKYCSTK